MAKRLRDVCALPESECSGAPDAASSSMTVQEILDAHIAKKLV